MSSLAQLKNRLRSEANVQIATEADAEARLDQWIVEAVRKHAPEFTGQTSLPDSKDEGVVILAWVNLCYHRAGRHVNTASTIGANGLGAQRDSPYEKNMAMARELQNRYQRIVTAEFVSAMGGPANGAITLGHLFIQSPITGTTEGADRPRIIVTLRASAPVNEQVVLTWESEYISDYTDSYVFSGSMSDIVASWNMIANNGVRGVHPDAELVFQTSDQSQKSFKVDLEPDTEYYFTVCARTLRDRFYFSNPVRIYFSA